MTEVSVETPFTNSKVLSLSLNMIISLIIARWSIFNKCNCRSRFDKFVYFNRPRTHGVRDREPSRIPKKRITRILKKSRKVRRLLRAYVRKSIPKSSRMHLLIYKAGEKIYAHGIRCENKGTTKYPSSAVRRKYPKSKTQRILKI